MVSKDTHIQFKVKKIGNVYKLQNSGGGSLHSASSSSSLNSEAHQEKTPCIKGSRLDVLAHSNDFGSRPIGTQESQVLYSFVNMNSSISCLDDSKDCWVNKFRSGLNLFNQIKL